MAKRLKPLEFDAIAGSEVRDQHGEVLSVSGADISDLEAGKGIINADHSNTFTDTIGRITNAKKIFTVDDCTDERHKYYWDKVKSPYIYVRAVLFDDEDHSNAKAAAAILRNIHRNDTPLSLSCSVEGSILQRGIKDPRELTRTKVSKLSLTFTPANRNTCVEPLNLSKSNTWEKDQILLNSIKHLAKSDKFRSFRSIARHAQATHIHNTIQKLPINSPLKDVTVDQWSSYGAYKKLSKNIEDIHQMVTDSKQPLEKALTAGYGGAGVPTSATGGSVLQSESLDGQNRTTNLTGFKYVSCSKCGNEAIHFPNQTKCRDCSHAYSFEQLIKLMTS